jgi:hypothetical protein
MQDLRKRKERGKKGQGIGVEGKVRSKKVGKTTAAAESNSKIIVTAEDLPGHVTEMTKSRG